MAKRKVEGGSVETTYTVVELDPVRNFIARSLFNIMGLRNVTFMSLSTKFTPSPVKKPNPKKAAKPKKVKKKAR